ncbi:sodium:proton antiporter [Pseudomonas sp. PDNC002]|uniref:sodium:proton antiporter n=1 Tax=Pseudomonas sp. PDNC002 TaxID=2811422 RepID=UPI0019653253|nr:sodium:proton antiporter [Pseudomonas sp. PDNC002]QRY79983.1 sodium:proton antiporter [Pseudomonas sp. PDNC002]
MLTVLFWLAMPPLFALAVIGGRRLRLLPIVSQLLVAGLLLPALFVALQGQGFEVRTLVTAPWLRLLYDIGFALLLGHILSDVIDLDVSRQSLKIALPSFAVPLVCGMASAWWLLGVREGMNVLGIGLLFSITAIPVLYLFLRNIDYPEDATRRLMHAAVLMDLWCWSLFGLAQSSSDPSKLVWPLLAGGAPLLLHLLRVRHALAYSVPFFGLMIAFQHWHLNTLVFAITWLMAQAAVHQPFRLPASPQVAQALQNYLLVPLVLAFGILQIDFHNALSGYSWLYLGALLVLPVASKLVGSWLGLRWALPGTDRRTLWTESLLLNIRGLTEIVFLNLLFQQGHIDSLLYFSLLLMSLFATLLPALCGIRRPHGATVSQPDSQDIAPARSPTDARP